jgi:hypothetical protein
VKRLSCFLLLAFVAVFTLAPVVRAQNLPSGGQPMDIHERMHQMMAGATTVMELHEQMHQMHQMMTGMAMPMDMHEQMHQMMAGAMTPMDMHEQMHQMMTEMAMPMVLPDTGGTSGASLGLLTAIALIGLGLLSRFCCHGVALRPNIPNESRPNSLDQAATQAE